jgi:hypothetical protein
LLTDFVCLYNYEFGLSLCKIVRSSVILLLPLCVIVIIRGNNVTGSEQLTKLVDMLLDFSTLYSTIPHSKLNDRVREFVQATVFHKKD